MKLPPLSRAEVRRVDQRAMESFEMCGLVLMENAGRGAAEIIDRVTPKQASVAILCGRGNNAGDGYVIARHLELLGRRIKLLSLVDFDTLEGDALANYRVAQAAEIPCDRVGTPEAITAQLESFDVVVECLLGTGATGAPRDLMGEAVRLVNAMSITRIAIDVPAGLDCDSGAANEPTFRADHTITFVAEKIGFSRQEAKPFLGHVHPVGIGVPKKLLDEFVPSQGQ